MPWTRPRCLRKDVALNKAAVAIILDIAAGQPQGRAVEKATGHPRARCRRNACGTTVGALSQDGHGCSAVARARRRLRREREWPPYGKAMRQLPRTWLQNGYRTVTAQSSSCGYDLCGLLQRLRLLQRCIFYCCSSSLLLQLLLLQPLSASVAPASAAPVRCPSQLQVLPPQLLLLLAASCRQLRSSPPSASCGLQATG